MSSTVLPTMKTVLWFTMLALASVALRADEDEV